MKATQILAAPLAAGAAGLVAAQSPNAQQDKVSVFAGADGYRYYGCYNETTQVEGSAETRALSGGESLVKPGEMTVPMCLQFCGGGKTKYRYAGVEWSRECWCAQNIAGIAAKLDDAQCNFPCEGNKTQACGGSLKLSVYRAGSASLSTSVSAAAVALALTGVLVTMFS